MAVPGILLGTLVLCAAPARGQLAIYVNDHGKRVYINADEPARRRGSSPAVSTVQGSSRATQASAGVSRTMGTPRRPSKERLERLVFETAERHQVDPAMVRAVIEAESNWNPSAVSRKGAQGLMQLVPGTAERFGVGDAFNPKQNLDGGVRYLRVLLERYNGNLDKALAAYNAGEGAVDRARGVPNYRETRIYVQRVIDSYFQSGSDRLPNGWNGSRPIYRTIDERGRVVYTNE